MAELPEPQFVDRDPVRILKECIAFFEAEAGRPLEPAQVERIIIDLIVYREAKALIALQEAAKQNLRRYARFPMIDYLAEMIGGGRVEAKKATTTERFELPVALGVPTPIPEGTRVRSKDGKVIFTTNADATIDTGDLYVDVDVTATDAGPLANGYAPGQISEIVDDLGVTITATNLTETSGGSPSEDTERFRIRFPDILGEYAVAGPEDAYRAHALKAHPDVADVYVESHDPDVVGSPEPGIARIHLLATYGEPSDDLVAVVLAALSPKDVRPTCDKVEVVKAVEVTYAIQATLDLRKGSLAAPTVQAAQEAAEEFKIERRRRLGRSIVRTQLTNKLSRPELDEETDPVSVKRPELASVYRVNLPLPAADVELAPNEFATCTDVDITFGAFVEEA